MPQTHSADFSIAHHHDTDHSVVLPTADMDESHVDRQGDCLSTSLIARQAVKRYYELDDQPAIIKKARKLVTDPNRLFILKVSPGLQAKFSRLPSAGGVLTINAGTYTLEQVHMKTGVHIRVHPDVIFKSVFLSENFIMISRLLLGFYINQ